MQGEEFLLSIAEVSIGLIAFTTIVVALRTAAAAIITDDPVPVRTPALRS